MEISKAISNNPYNPHRGSLSAYIRYLRYNVDGFYHKKSSEVRKIYEKYLEEKK